MHSYFSRCHVTTNSVAPPPLYKLHTTHNSSIRSKRQLSESLYGDQFTLSTPLIKPNFCIQLPHRRSTTVSLETTPFVLTIYTENPEILVGKSNGTYHSMWNVSDIMGHRLKQCPCSVIFNFSTDTSTFCNLSILRKWQYWIFTPKSSTWMDSVNGKHPKFFQRTKALLAEAEQCIYAVSVVGDIDRIEMLHERLAEAGETVFILKERAAELISSDRDL